MVEEEAEVEAEVEAAPASGPFDALVGFTLGNSEGLLSMQPRRNEIRMEICK